MRRFGFAIALGVATRASAMLLLGLCIVTSCAIYPMTFADDAAVASLCVFLSLLPLGRGCSLNRRGRFTPCDPEKSLSGVAATALLVNVCVFYSTGAIGDLCGAPAASRGAVLLASRLVPIGLATPSPIGQGLALIVQLGLHAYLGTHTPAIVTNAILASTCILFVGERRPAGPSVVLDAGGVLAAAYVLVWIVGATGPALAPSVGGLGARRMLSDLAVVPPEVTLPARADVEVLATIEDERGHRRSYQGAVGGVRAALLDARLADAPMPWRMALAFGKARNTAATRCTGPGRHVDRS